MTLSCSKCRFRPPLRMSSPTITCQALGSSANWHAISCNRAATAVPWQWGEHMSLVIASITTTVGRVRRACLTYSCRPLTRIHPTPMMSTLSYSSSTSQSARLNACFIRRTKLWPTINRRLSLQWCMKDVGQTNAINSVLPS